LSNPKVGPVHHGILDAQLSLLLLHPHRGHDRFLQTRIFDPLGMKV